MLVAMQASIDQVQRELPELVGLVERGETILILRHGKPAAQIVPLTGRGKAWRVERADDPRAYAGLDLDEPILDDSEM